MPRVSGSTSVERADRRLLQVVDEAMAEAARLAGDRLACRPGCTGCCHGPFPINALEVRRLRRGLAELAARDSERATAVVERARAQAEIFRPGFPGDPASGRLADDRDDDGAQEAFFAAHGAASCPVLDPATGRCELYAHRPLTCRTFGPPVRIGEADLPPCNLCFVGTPQEEVDACRVEPDPHGLEDRLLARFAPDEDHETVIAYALADPS